MTVRKRMYLHMRTRFKWTHRELHDALRIVGLNVPDRPSLLSYFHILHSQFGDTQIGFLPQAFRTHTKNKLQDMSLKCLSRTGLKMGGKLADVKSVLADRLAFWLNQVVEAGREVHGEELDGAEMIDSNSDSELHTRQRSKGRTLLPRTHEIGEVPADAVVTPEQAESALGHAQATEFDDDVLELLGQELRQEEEALMGRQVNPTGPDYTLLIGELADTGTAQRLGWQEALGSPRTLNVHDFAFTAQEVETRLQGGVEAMYSKCNAALLKDADVKVDTLDPTQHVAYTLVAEWAQA